MVLKNEIVHFLGGQGFVIVSTIDEQGYIHSSAKGIVDIEKKGTVYLIDLYRAKTFSNLRRNPLMSITAVDEHRFLGFTLKGKGRIVEASKIDERHISDWEERVTKRISKRVIKNIRRDQTTRHHPEARFPHPQYLIEMDVEEVVDLAPGHLKKTPI